MSETQEYRWQVEELSPEEIRQLNAGGKAELPSCQDSPGAGWGDADAEELDQ